MTITIITLICSILQSLKFINFFSHFLLFFLLFINSALNLLIFLKNAKQLSLSRNNDLQSTAIYMKYYFF